MIPITGPCCDAVTLRPCDPTPVPSHLAPTPSLGLSYRLLG